MPRRPNNPDQQAQRSPVEHIAVKNDAFRSQAVQALVTNTLIIGGTDADVRLLISLLRASLGRHVEARMAIGPEAIAGILESLPGDTGDSAPSLADKSSRQGIQPNLVLLRDSPDHGVRALDLIPRWRAHGIQSPIIVIHERMGAHDASALRQIAPLDAIEADDLDSVRLFEALLKAVSPSS